MSKISVYHIDDHQLFVQGIKSLIEAESIIQWIGSAHTAYEGIQDMLNFKPDVLLLDYFLPDMNGLEVAQRILSIIPSISILVLSMETNPELIKKSIKAGVIGFLPKTTDKQSLLHAIQTVNAKKTLFPELTSEPREKESMFDLLSKREKEIALLIAQGYTSSEIADKLFLSLLTVNTHRRNLINKLNLNNTAQLSALISKLSFDKF